jgi:hypothetical protein
MKEIGGKFLHRCWFDTTGMNWVPWLDVKYNLMLQTYNNKESGMEGTVWGMMSGGEREAIGNAVYNGGKQLQRYCGGDGEWIDVPCVTNFGAAYRLKPDAAVRTLFDFGSLPMPCIVRERGEMVEYMPMAKDKNGVSLFYYKGDSSGTRMMMTYKGLAERWEWRYSTNCDWRPCIKESL